jgi:hypothetical protein
MKLSPRWWRAYRWARRRGVNKPTSHMYADHIQLTGHVIGPESFEAHLQSRVDFILKEFPDLPGLFR